MCSLNLFIQSMSTLENWVNSIDMNKNLEFSRVNENLEFSRVNKILGKDCKAIIQKLPPQYQWKLKEFFGINPPKKISNWELRKKVQSLRWLQRWWRDIDKIFTILENPQDTENRFNEISLNKLNRIGNLQLTTKAEFLSLMEDENSEDLVNLALDNVSFIHTRQWNIFTATIPLSAEWLSSFQKLYPNDNPNNVSLKRLKEHKFLGDQKIKNVIETELNQKFLSAFDDKLWDSTDPKETQTYINNILKDKEFIKFFVEYNNYKYAGTSKEIKIDPNKPLTPANKSIIEKAIKEELYANQFVVDLTNDEKEVIDADIEEEIEQARINRIRWDTRRYGEFRRLMSWRIDSQISNYDKDPGWKIAVDLNLWDELSDKFGTKVDMIDINNPKVFEYARIKFCKNNANLKLRGLSHLAKNVYIETRWFTDFKGEWKNISELRNHLGRNMRDFENLTKWFWRYLENAQKSVSLIWSKMNKNKNLITNNAAIGSVIDGVREIFSHLWESENSDNQLNSLHLDKQEPIKLENWSNSLIIKWTFKWNPVKIKYDLITWNVYMNTSIAENSVWSMIVFWNNEPIFPVWKIENFPSILNNFESEPKTNSAWLKQNTKSRKDKIEMRKNRFNQKKSVFIKQFEEWIRKTWENIWPQLETNQIKNDISTKVLKTLWIIDNNTNWTLQFESGSDIYKVMQIINNSWPSEIQQFEKYMSELTKYAWRNWWNKELNQSEEYLKMRELIENLNKNSSNDEYSLLKEFREKTIWFKPYEWQRWQISKDYKNWLTSIIYEKFAEWTEPNWKLNAIKIEQFVENLKNQYSDASLISSLWWI